MPVVEGLAAGGHWADKICSELVIRQVSLQMANRSKFFLARIMRALEHLALVLIVCRRFLELLATEALAWSTEA